MRGIGSGWTWSPRAKGCLTRRLHLTKGLAVNGGWSDAKAGFMARGIVFEGFSDVRM
jgi:hypothetical protein